MRLRNFIFISVITLFSSLCFGGVGKMKDIKIIPMPVSIEIGEGEFNLTDGMVIAADEKAKSTARYLRDMLSPATGFEFEIESEGKKVGDGEIRLELDLEDSEIGEEGYKLYCDGDVILITARSEKGLFYGCQTLRQLLPVEIESSEKVDGVEWSVPAVVIKDGPSYRWRGMHLDVSRHFFDKEFVKRYIDLIAMHKMNVFHWHLTDDPGWRIEIKKYPKLCEISAWRVDREDMPWRKRTGPKDGEKATYGGYYTQEEIREVVAYAGERHIMVVPEIEMPGHCSEVFAAYPEFSCRGIKSFVKPGGYYEPLDVFCAGKEGTFEFLQDVIDEVVELFPGRYIHVGGDEVDKRFWVDCDKCQKRIKDENLKDVNELQSYFIKRMEKYINSKGKRLIGWDEILEGGLAPSATVMSWRGMEGGIKAANMGHDVIMCPVEYCYFDYYQGKPEQEPEAIGGYLPLEKVYSFSPMPSDLSKDKVKHVLGGQGNLWTEFIGTEDHAEYMALPRMSALCEVLWSSEDKMDYEDFVRRLDNLYVRFEKLGYNYRSYK